MSRRKNTQAANRFPVLARLRDLYNNRSGSMSLVFGLAVPVIFAATGAAVDFGLYLRERTALQALVDAAAIASARELQMAKADQSKIDAVAKSYVHSREPSASVQTDVDVKAFSVKVTGQKPYEPAMGILFWETEPMVKVSATAKLNGRMPLCLLALERASHAAVHLEQSAMMTAPECMVYSNSKHASGVQAKDAAIVKAGLICSAGGKGRASSAKFTPEPVLDCPQLDDPLHSRTLPPVGQCKFTGKVVKGGSQVLQPGVYCKGLRITDGAEVTLTKGIYVIKDGPLIVDNGAIMNGAGVAIYMKGKRANLTFEVNSTINLSAPKDGPLAGILIMDDPSGAEAPALPPYPLPIPLLGELLGVVGGLLGLNPPEGPPREHKILSDNARLLLGTIYMPKGRLIVDATKPIADKSAYTVIVVQRIDLHAGPNLVLNSDYSASDVPVPKGVGPYGSNVMLTH